MPVFRRMAQLGTLSRSSEYYSPDLAAHLVLIKDLLFSITNADVLFIFEYHKNFDFHLKLGNFAQKRGAKIILMTGYSTSPVVTLANETLIVHRGMTSFKHSMAVPMTVVNNLMLAVEFTLGDKRQAFLEEWNMLYQT